jgi:hypothetical protein
VGQDLQVSSDALADDVINFIGQMVDMLSIVMIVSRKGLESLGRSEDS